MPHPLDNPTSHLARVIAFDFIAHHWIELVAGLATIEPERVLAFQDQLERALAERAFEFRTATLVAGRPTEALEVAFDLLKAVCDEARTAILDARHPQ